MSQSMRQMIEAPKPRGDDNKYHHHHEPCSDLEQLVASVHRQRASEVTLLLIGRVNRVYIELRNFPNLRDACEEISPMVLKSVIHPSVKNLDCLRYSRHRELIDYYKIENCDLIYKTTSLLKGLTDLGIGKAQRTEEMRLELRGFSDTLQKFSSRSCVDRDVEILAENCRKLKCLDISYSKGISILAVASILRFRHLEELNVGGINNSGDFPLDLLNNLIEDDLSRGMNVGEGRDSAETAVTSQSPTSTIFRTKFLKKFGFSCSKTLYVISVTLLSNLTSLVLTDVKNCTLTPLVSLKSLREFTLWFSTYKLVEGFLKSVGSQLNCLNFTDVTGTSFDDIVRYCTSVECLHLCFSRSDDLRLPMNWNVPGAILNSSDTLPSVRTLQLLLDDLAIAEYILTCVRNLRTLFFGTLFDRYFYEVVMQRVHCPLLRNFYWGDNVAVTFEGRNASITKFYSNGKRKVQNVVVE